MSVSAPYLLYISPTSPLYLPDQVARNVMSVSAHIAEYQRIIMELRNQVAGLKSQLADRPTTIQEGAHPSPNP